MVFSSLLVYQDPTNWQQQPPGGGSSASNPRLSLPVPPLPPSIGGDGTGSVRPSPTADRARLAKLPQIDQVALKCPRCESTNTKFCYFNNYSLTQPRHFCKTCRRYWTRGGALRNVPVGGGCRRNKRSKGSKSSKSLVTSEHQVNSSSNSAVSSNTIAPLPGPPQQLPFLPSLHHLTNYGAGNIGLNFAGIQPPVEVTGSGACMEFQINTSSSGCGTILSDRFSEHWRSVQQVQQFPFLAGLEPPAGIYQFEGEGVEPPDYVSAHLGSKAPLDSVVTHELATMKLEEENQGLNLSRNFSGISGNDHYWGGNAWTDLSGFTSSSTSHL